MPGKLPPMWEKKIKSDYLKEKIADLGMWTFIPGVDPNINSAKSKRRLKANETLFSFIDKYFPEGPFAFEPNMRDGRFMFLPDDVYHQGMAVGASLMIPGALEVGQFRYPEEFCSDHLTSHIDQVYVPSFTTSHDDELAEMVRDIYFEDVATPRSMFPHMKCDFPFFINLTVRLEGEFLDDVEASAKTIRDALQDQSDQIKRNGEGLIMFMERVAPKRS
jgi:hypothetical protein